MVLSIEDIFKVRRISQGMEKPFPYTGVRPAPAGMNRCPFAGRSQADRASALHWQPSTRWRRQIIGYQRHCGRAYQLAPEGCIAIRFHCSICRLRLLQGCSPSTTLNQNFMQKGILECRQALAALKAERGQVTFTSPLTGIAAIAEAARSARRNAPKGLGDEQPKAEPATIAGVVAARHIGLTMRSRISGRKPSPSS